MHIDYIDRYSPTAPFPKTLYQFAFSLRVNERKLQLKLESLNFSFPCKGCNISKFIEQIKHF